MFRRRAQRNDERVFDRASIDEMVLQVDKQATRLTRLVDDMLDIARMRSGKLTIEPEELELGEVVNDVMARMSAQFSALSSPLPQWTQREAAVGTWDRMRIEQVVTNLFTNAIRYGRGKPIEVSLVSRDERATLAIKDHGIGISIEEQSKIFERYERAVNASDVSGLGLGLFIAQQIVLAHGGRMRVESELGVGSIFFVDLPQRS